MAVELLAYAALKSQLKWLETLFEALENKTKCHLSLISLFSFSLVLTE